MKREDLETAALAAVSAANYYDLADCMSETTDDELRRIIAADGSETAEHDAVDRVVIPTPGTFYTERHLDGWAIFRSSDHEPVKQGRPHMWGTLYFKTRPELRKFMTDNNIKLEGDS